MLPGIFVALALRFDVSRGKGSQYFKSAFLGYAFGLILTIVVMNWFQAAQVGSLCFLMFPEQMNNYTLDNKLYHFLNVSVDQNILFPFSTFHPNMTLLLALSIGLISACTSLYRSIRDWIFGCTCHMEWGHQTSMYFSYDILRKFYFILKFH